MAAALAFTLAGFDGDADIHVMMNMYWGPLDFDVPAVAGRQWFIAVNTAEPSPSDIAEAGAEAPVTGVSCRVEARSVVALVGR